MKNNSKNAFIKTDLEIEYVDDKEQIKREVISVKNDQELEIVNSINESNDFENILRASFHQIKITKLFGKITLRTRTTKNYFFGERLTLSEYYMLTEKMNHFNEKQFEDEYQIGAVIHVKTGIITPIFSKDIIINPKEEKAKTLTIKR